MKLWLHAAVVSAALSGVPALSAPMGFNGSWMGMADVSPNWREGFANYALSPRDAVGPSLLYMRSDDKTRTRDAAEVVYTRLVKRWNLPDAQANIWFIGGAGVIRGNDFSGQRTLLSPGVQVDYETTRIYASAFARLYRAEGINHDFASARLGFSFYETDYDEVQPWLIVEARRMRGLSEKTEITPMLRVIHSRYFAEAGVSNARQLRVNFMYTF